MKTIEFAFDIGDKVHIADYPDIEGRVIGLSYRNEGITHCVVWWQNGERKQEWVHDWELRAVAEKLQ